MGHIPWTKPENPPNSSGAVWQNFYRDFHFHTTNQSPNADSRFLIYICEGKMRGCGGLGNRVQAIASLFYLALLTNRTFLVRWKGPGELQEFLEPNQINWVYVEGTLDHLASSKKYWGCCGTTAGTTVRREPEEQFQQWVATVDFSSVLTNPVEYIGSIWSFPKFLWQNPFLQRRIKDLDLPRYDPAVPYHLVGCALDFLFKKSSSFETLLSDTRQSLQINREGPLLGIHIRSNDKNFGVYVSPPRSRNTTSFFVCAERVHKLLEFFAKSRGSRMPKAKWFLAADNEYFKAYAYKYFTYPISTIDFVPRHIEYSRGGSDLLRDVLLDLYLLSECDYLVITRESTLSLLALAIGHHRARNDSFVDGETCAVSQTSLAPFLSRLDLREGEGEGNR